MERKLKNSESFGTNGKIPLKFSGKRKRKQSKPCVRRKRRTKYFMEKIPKDILCFRIFPFLEIIDLQQLRLVSQVTQVHVKVYAQSCLKKNLNHIININQSIFLKSSWKDTFMNFNLAEKAQNYSQEHFENASMCQAFKHISDASTLFFSKFGAYSEDHLYDAWFKILHFHIIILNSVHLNYNRMRFGENLYQLLSAAPRNIIANSLDFLYPMIIRKTIEFTLSTKKCRPFLYFLLQIVRKTRELITDRIWLIQTYQTMDEFQSKVFQELPEKYEKEIDQPEIISHIQQINHILQIQINSLPNQTTLIHITGEATLI